MTFSEYIKELRLRRAMSDLLYTDKPITQVAFDNGFTSSSFFNRSFREKYRKNPSEVRREFAGDENGRQAAGKVNTDLSERVNRLLDNDGRPIRELDREQLFTCSAADSTPMKQIWNYLINIGRAADLLELGTQEHLSILEETMPFFSRDFIDPNIGVHGPLFDLGIYHLAQMLYVLGMPELESVYGFQSSRYWTDPAIDKLVNRTAPVEDLGVGMARFKGDICMDIYEDWAIHMEDIGCSFIAGSLGGLKFTDVDQTGGPMAVPEGGQIMGGGDLQLPRLTYYGVNDENQLFETQLDCAIGDVTGQQELLIHPEMEMYNDNQLQWYSYLRGILTDETRIDSPYIAMQTALLSEGVVLSSELGRSVTVDEIKKMAKSIAIRDQETPFGTIHYDFDEYKPE